MWYVVGLGLIAALIWLCVLDSRGMDAKQKTFLAACAADGRKPYDCNMQWETYATARAAQIQAAAATGAAAGSAAR